MEVTCVARDHGTSQPVAVTLDRPRKSQELDIERVLLVPFGEPSPQSHMLVRTNFHLHVVYLCPIGNWVFLRSGQLAI